MPKRTPKKETHMKHFSPEYRDSLIAEHKLVSASIAHITDNHGKIIRNHSAAAVGGAVNNLLSRKIELEVMIDVLTDYLN